VASITIGPGITFGQGITVSTIQVGFYLSLDRTASTFDSGIITWDQITGGTGIVTSGLLLNLDATKSSSYPGSGTTWTDLSSNADNGTLVGSPTYTASPGYFTLGVGKYASTGVINSALTAATFISWIYPTQTQNSYTGIIFNRNGYGGATAYATGMDLYTSNSVGYHWNDNGATYGWNSGLYAPNNAWSMIAITVNSTTATAYLCQASGITTATNTTSHTSTLSGLSFYVGVEPYDTTGRAFVGRISQALVYNTTLSSTDITQNFSATRSIYGV
jgi:hypothetical protein